MYWNQVVHIGIILERLFYLVLNLDLDKDSGNDEGEVLLEQESLSIDYINPSMLPNKYFQVI